MATLANVSSGAITTSVNNPDPNDRFYWARRVERSSTILGVPNNDNFGQGSTQPNSNADGALLAYLWTPQWRGARSITDLLGVSRANEGARLFTIVRIAIYQDGREVVDRYTARFLNAFGAGAFACNVPDGTNSTYATTTHPDGVEAWARETSFLAQPPSAHPVTRSGLQTIRNYVLDAEGIDVHVETTFITDCVNLQGLSSSVGSGDSGTAFNRPLAINNVGKIGVAPANAAVNPGIEFMQFSSVQDGNNIGLNVNYFGSAVNAPITNRAMGDSLPVSVLTNVLDQHYDLSVQGHEAAMGDNTTLSSALGTLDFNNDDFILSTADSGETVNVSLRGGTSGGGVEVRDDATVIANTANQIRFGAGLAAAAFDSSDMATTTQDDISYVTIDVDSTVTRRVTSAFTATEMTPGSGTFMSVISHTFNTRWPSVSVYDNNNQMVIPSSVSATATNQITITFPQAVTGMVTLIG